MGEAKRRSAEITKLKELHNAWRAGLTEEEKVIAQVAERLDERVVRGRRFVGGCYHLAFFMTRYLALRGIHVTPVVGWINDGRWQGVASHAWVEYDGKITDASLTFTEYPDELPTGALIVQDHVLRPGAVTYAYYKETDPAVQAGLDWIRSQPELAQAFQHKAAEHQSMALLVQEAKIDVYLSRAPAGGRFADLAALIA